MTKFHCLVTGGAGFIGSNLVKYLLEQGHQVIALDDLSTGKVTNLHPGATFVNGSILDNALVERIVGEVEIVFHTAALARVQRSIDDPVGTHAANVTGTLILLNAARKARVRKFVYSSSSSVYGNQASHMMLESMLPAPMSPYGLQKLMGELYCNMMARTFGLPCVSLRYFNVYGPNQTVDGPYSLVIGKFLAQGKANKKLTIYGDGTQTRSFTYISDVVIANYLAMMASTNQNENLIVNIGTNQETSVMDIALAVGGDYELIQPNPRGEFEELRKAADFSLARARLGWEPTVSFDSGMKLVRNTCG